MLPPASYPLHTFPYSLPLPGRFFLCVCCQSPVVSCYGNLSKPRSASLIHAVIGVFGSQVPASCSYKTVLSFCFFFCSCQRMVFVGIPTGNRSSVDLQLSFLMENYEVERTLYHYEAAAGEIFVRGGINKTAAAREPCQHSAPALGVNGHNYEPRISSSV